MERLTRRIYGVVVYVGAENPYSTGQIPCEVEPAGVREMMDRLAAYEDTGRTPEEVSTLIKDFSDLCTIVGECGGISRVRALTEADKNGRVMIAPCKVGDTAYWVHNRTVTVCRVYRIQMNRKGMFICLKSNKSHGAFRADVCLGKTIFFSSDEAEKALEVSE